MNMNFPVKKILKWMAIIAIFFFIFISSVYFTMSSLIKGKELVTPNWIGKAVSSAFEESKQLGIQMVPIEGSRLTEGLPFSITRQFPEPGVRIKQFGIVKVYFTPKPDKIFMPDVRGKGLEEALKIITEKGLKKGGISYMDNEIAPVDHVICQGVLPGDPLNRGESVDILVSRGPRPISYVMPDFVGMSIIKVDGFLQSHGLKVAKIEAIPYPGLENGVIVKQYPHSGYRINSRNLILFGVSQ